MQHGLSLFVKTITTEKNFPVFGKFWSECVAIHMPGAWCARSLPTGICWAGAMSSFRYSGKLLSLERLSGTTNLGWVRAGDLVIWGSISYSFEPLNPLPVSSHNNFSFLWIFCQWELEGGRATAIRFFQYSGGSQLGVLHFFILKRKDVCKSKRPGKLSASQNCQLGFLCLLHLTWWRFLLSVSSNTGTLSVTGGTQMLGFKLPLLMFLRSWAAACASCYSSQPRDKCQSWHKRYLSEVNSKGKFLPLHAWARCTCYCMCGLLMPDTTEAEAAIEFS